MIRSLSSVTRCAVYWWLFTAISEQRAASNFKIVHNEWIGIYPEYGGRSASDSSATNYQVTKRHVSKVCKMQNPLLGAFPKFRIGTIITFIVAVSLSVCPSVWKKTRLPLDDFHEIWYLSIFRKTVAKLRFSLKYDINNGYFTFLTISRSS